MTHTTVYGAPDVYAGWPANHGAWQWGNELLFGFLRGPWAPTGMHNITEPFEKVFARSQDGGLTWAVEKPDVDFECVFPETPLLFIPNTDILRFCGVYDHGGDYCHPRGGYYLSGDRGRVWKGPCAIKWEEPSPFASVRFVNTSRTCHLPGTNFYFLSCARRQHWGTDVTYCCEYVDGSFRIRSRVTADGDIYRAVMPSVTRIGNRIVCCLRRRTVDGHCWISVHVSDDEAKTWCGVYKGAVDVGGQNGNPPALASDGKNLFLTFAHRDRYSMYATASSDGGETWERQGCLRQGMCLDIGYPQLFAVGNTLVCVYYWSDEGEPQRIEATRFTLDDLTEQPVREDDES